MIHVITGSVVVPFSSSLPCPTPVQASLIHYLPLSSFWPPHANFFSRDMRPPDSTEVLPILQQQYMIPVAICFLCTIVTFYVFYAI
ncbi:hypothetical protein CANARDRAFT_57019 [[Candida] arabinofermentans NRRL YB-2248]|uniref:Uncharacterized protein n=1 Tax=[Candida] arabinofermentans NRRL YB-2248 TaxID=983967 RepID=A0A1E4T8J5_9ASCO|nr:hypothetical protein CANARDRAFT_57019 [[Candida] arabinofermentans NRRL YB-2248]